MDYVWKLCLPNVPKKALRNCVSWVSLRSTQPTCTGAGTQYVGFRCALPNLHAVHVPPHSTSLLPRRRQRCFFTGGGDFCPGHDFVYHGRQIPLRRLLPQRVFYLVA